METRTTPEMIAAAKSIADALKTVPGVIRAWADDWGTFGNFSLFIDIAQRGDVDLRLIRRALKQAVKHFAPKGQLRTVIMPRRVYTPRAWGRPQFAGWDSDGRRFEGYGQISISLDFYAYSSASNSFPAIQPDGPFELGAWGKPAYPQGAPQPAIT